jgi:hypothetical protein
MILTREWSFDTNFGGRASIELRRRIAGSFAAKTQTLHVKKLGCRDYSIAISGLRSACGQAIYTLWS